MPQAYTLRLHAGSDYEITISITVLGHRSVNVGGRTLQVIFGLGFKTYKAKGGLGFRVQARVHRVEEVYCLCHVRA